MTTLLETPVETVRTPAKTSWALAGLSLSVLLSSLDTSIANTALPVLVQAFHAGFQGVQWIVLAYLLASTTLLVSVGRLGDVVGRRRLLTAGLALFTASSVLCALAPALWLLIAARALQGVGAAVMLALAVAFASEIVPKSETGRAMGLLGTMSAIGTSLGPSLGGVLTATAGWPAIFLVNVPVGLAALFLVWCHVPADGPATARRAFDAVGTGLLALALAAYALAMTLGHGRFSIRNGALLAAAAVSAGGFVCWQRRAVAPLIDWMLFRYPGRAASLALSLAVSTVLMATLVVGPFYLSRALGLQVAWVGLVMSVGPLVAALTGIPAGRLVDRVGAGRTSVAGLAGIATGTSLLALLPARLGVPGYLGPIVITTAGYALFQAANNTGFLRTAGAAERGVLSGLLNLSRNLGLITGAAVVGALFAQVAGPVATASPERVAAGMHTTFAAAAVIMTGAVAVAWRTKRQ